MNPYYYKIREMKKIVAEWYAMEQIINEYKTLECIEDITEEELTDIFGQSILPPAEYFPYGEGFFVEINYYNDYLLNHGINPFEGWEFSVIQDYLDNLLQTEDGIDLGEFECMSRGEFEFEQFYDLKGIKTETEDVYCSDADDAINWYYAPMDEITLHRRIHCDAGDGKFLIIKTDADFFYFYGVYLEFEYDENGRRIELGTCIDPDDVIKIIMYYINTGESYGHR